MSLDDQPAQPGTGHPAVDQALSRLNGLEQQPLAEHHGRLSGVYLELERALHSRDADHPESD